MRSSQTTENIVDERTLLVHAHFDDPEVLLEMLSAPRFGL